MGAEDDAFVPSATLARTPLHPNANAAAPHSAVAAATPQELPAKSPRKVSKARMYRFDRVYATDCTQKEIFDGSVAPLVQNALDGFNATIFAYGSVFFVPLCLRSLFPTTFVLPFPHVFCLFFFFSSVFCYHSLTHSCASTAPHRCIGSDRPLS